MNNKAAVCVRHGTVAEIFFPTEVTTKIETVESKEQQTVVLKVEQADEMLQTVPRVPVAGIKRRWGNRHTGSLQESSPEVSSSGVLSPPPNFQPSTPESAVVKNEELQLWDLDLHRGLQTNGDHYRATITATTTTTVLPTVTDPASPFTTPIEGLCIGDFSLHRVSFIALRKRIVDTCTWIVAYQDAFANVILFLNKNYMIFLSCYLDF